MDPGQTARIQSRYDRQALFYDLMEAPMELLATTRLRKRLWAQVGEGALLEVGVGTGKNLPHHPRAKRTVAVDFSPRMLRRAASRARRLGRDVDLVLADAQQLPFRDRVFDAAAATFVFCSVPDPVAGLEEIRRVVREGGRVHLLEHVRAQTPLLGRLMDLLNPLSVRLSGANINRDTVSNVMKAGISLDSVESRFGIVRLIRGQPSEAAPSGERAAAAEAAGAIVDVALG